MWDFVVAFAAVGVLALLFYTPKKLYEGVMLMQYGSVPAEERFKMWIPVYNVVKAENIYKGGRHCFILPSYIAIVVTILVRVVTISIGIESFVLELAEVVFVLLAILLAYVANAVLVWSIMHDAGCVSLVMLVVYTLIYPIGQDYIGKFLPANVESIMKKDRTF